MIDPAQLSDLFEAHAAALVLYARQILAEQASAEDVVHDAFVKLMTQSSEPRDARGWLYRVVRNACISRRRSWWRRVQRERSIGRMRTEMFESRLENLIDAKAAGTALQSLEAEQREVVVLKIWGRMGFQEISDLVGCGVSTVHDRYKSALVALKRKLEKSPCPNKTP